MFIEAPTAAVLASEWTKAHKAAEVLTRRHGREQVMGEQTMRVEEAARFLKLDVWAVEAAIECGELPSVILGGEVLVDWCALMRMLDPQGVAS